MKKIGYVLIAVGFVAGALLAVLDEETVAWAYFSIALAVGAAGVVLVHLAQRRRGRETGVLETDVAEVEESLEKIAAAVRQLDREKHEIGVYQIRDHIDDRLLTDISTFVDARESIGHVYGLEAYADMMTHFAAGERYLNRVWSASADGYVDEARTYLERAETQFREARDTVRELTAAET